ncbi:MAG TPA: M14 family metallopeptidase [Vicinamibacterales bacterium]|nr:M14 family metallopeptidase [Vicinamibacterales bacterium]
MKNLVTAALLLLSVSRLDAQPLWPGSTYDPKIPTIQSVLGYDFGDEITSPDNIVVYLKALAAAAPDRTRLIEYARTWEKRPLHVLVVSSAERLARIDEIKAGLARLADPRGMAAGEGERLVRELPVVTWLLHAIHGNEISSSDAALAEAYHLLAARGDADVDQVLRQSIVLIDPLENPDGRARFLSSNLQGRAAAPDPEPFAAERDEPWPGGRSNHYLFDMNRDYLAQSQPETEGRRKVLLEWRPQVVADLHEMGGNSTYYFAPPAVPINPNITKDQMKWFETFGRANAAAFDARGFAYFTREVYDSFYPGYGESWPIFQGAVGMTYEQASPRGLVLRRDDGTLLRYRDAVHHHFTAAVTTAATAAKNREALLRDFLEYRRSAVAQGEQGTREYLLVPGADPSRAERLARLLTWHGIDVRRAEEPVKLASRTLPAGTYLVSAAQPTGRLIRNLLEQQVPQDEAFIKEQDRRRRERIGDQIYDLTAWSLPLAFDVESVTSDRPVTVKASAFAEQPRVSLPAAKVAYLIPWGSGAAATAAPLLAAGVRLDFASRPFTIAGRRFAAGTAIARVAGNVPDLTERLEAAAANNPGLEIVPADSGWVDEGISLGSGQVQRLKAPTVAMAWDTPTSSLSAGWMRYVIERRFRQSVTAVRAARLGNIDLHRFDVLALPSGSYSFSEDVLRRLKDWIRAGGTLVTVGEASRWAARERVGLLETRTLLRDGTPETEPAEDQKKPDAKPDAEYVKAVQPERERPENTPGAMLRVALDQEHWLSSGFDGEIAALVESNRVFAPIRLDKGRNVGLYAKKDRLLASGLAWDEAQALLAEKPFLIHQPLGQGHVIAFAEDPNYRAFAEATELLFMNAILLGPAH